MNEQITIDKTTDGAAPVAILEQGIADEDHPVAVSYLVKCVHCGGVYTLDSEHIPGDEVDRTYRDWTLALGDLEDKLKYEGETT